MEHLEDQLRRAAAAIVSADAMIVFTGAGMGVDSGLGTYRGPNAGVWKAGDDAGLSYTDLCRPTWFDNDGDDHSSGGEHSHCRIFGDDSSDNPPVYSESAGATSKQIHARLAWSFWKFQHNLYTSETAPHDGYRLLIKWGQEHAKRHGLFSVTSNVDGHWIRAMRSAQEEEGDPGGGSCVPASACSTHAENRRVYEVHGSLTHMQLVHPSPSFVALATEMQGQQQLQGSDEPGCRERQARGGGEEHGWVGPVWEVRADRDYHPMICDNTNNVGSVSAASPLPAYPVPAADVLRAMKATKTVHHTGCDDGGGDDGDEGPPAEVQVAAVTRALRCRPNVLMFGDAHWDWTRAIKQSGHFDEWKARLGGSKVVIIEIGAGQAVKTIRQLAESEAAVFTDATLVRINFSVEDSLIPDYVTEFESQSAVPMAGRGISIGGLSALEVLSRIDQHISMLNSL